MQYHRYPELAEDRTAPMKSEPANDVLGAPRAGRFVERRRR
jgi:hypothetical protein